MFTAKRGRSAGDAPTQKRHDHQQCPPFTANTNSTQADFFLHEIRARIMRPLTPIQWHDLRANCDDAYMLTLSPDKVHRIANYQDAPLVVVMPKPPALRLLDDLHGIILNYVEFAYDRTVSNPLALQRFFEEHFVHPWHGGHQTVVATAEQHVSYSGQPRPGHRFGWYGDRPSKLTGEIDHCFHLEARYMSAAALHRLGVHRPGDLLTFNHQAHWDRALKQLFIVDMERLGRLNFNRLRRERRHASSSSEQRQRDAAEGERIYRILARDPLQPERHAVQHLIDRVGRGPHLIPITLEAAITLLEMVMPTNRFLVPNAFRHQDKVGSITYFSAISKITTPTES